MERVKTWYVRKQKLNVTIQYNSTKMFYFDYITKEDRKEHWLQIPDHPHKILIVTDKIYL